MIFKIRYFRADMHLADADWDDTRGDPMAGARSGLARHRATRAVLLDDQGIELAVVHDREP